jgi:hypothetical protein
MALKSKTIAWIFFLFAALAGGCSLLFQSIVFEYVPFWNVWWIFDWMFLLWVSGFVLCLVFLIIGVYRLRKSDDVSR